MYYNRVFNDKLDFQGNVDDKAKDLIERLLDKNHQTRLGCYKGI